MVSRSKTVAILVALSLIIIMSMGAIETRLIQNHFLESSAEQVKLSAEQLANAIADLKVPAEDNETCQEVAAWIGYNTGMRVLIIGPDNTIVVDSSGEESLVGEVIESKLLKSTIETGEINSFDFPLAGQDEVAISAPWQTGDGISGSLVMVGPLKDFARDATNQLKPFILKSGLGAMLIAVVSSLIISTKLSSGAATENHPVVADSAVTECDSGGTLTAGAAEAEAKHTGSTEEAKSPEQERAVETTDQTEQP